MALTAKQRKYLKALAHARKAVVQVGNAGVTDRNEARAARQGCRDCGFTDAVLKETARALERHELIKVRLPAVERAARAELTRKLCEGTEAEAVQEIGRVAVLYRPAQKPRLKLPE